MLLVAMGWAVVSGAQTDTTRIPVPSPVPDSSSRPAVTTVPDTTQLQNIQLAADTTPQYNNPVFEKDSVFRDPNARSPRKAAIRSAILPGWGQVYNKKIWKVPIVYAALGATAFFFIDNLVWYKRFRYGYNVAYNIQQGTDSLGSSAYQQVYPQIREVFFEGNYGIRADDIRVYRDNYRRDVDYAVLYFVIAWALNVIDATVDAHLSTFDVSPDLSLYVKPGYSELARTNGLSLVLRIK
ncbi:hypothetical protein GCM10027051_23460 [Niabella terrae]